MEPLRKLWEILQESNIKSTLIKAFKNLYQSLIYTRKFIQDQE
jgi:hypothetical protein